jgi:hypothetical protein
MNCQDVENYYNRTGYDRLAKLAPIYRTSYGCITRVKSHTIAKHPQYASIEEAYPSRINIGGGKEVTYKM